MENLKAKGVASIPNKYQPPILFRKVKYLIPTLIKQINVLDLQSVLLFSSLYSLPFLLYNCSLHGASQLKDVKMFDWSILNTNDRLLNCILLIFFQINIINSPHNNKAYICRGVLCFNKRKGTI